MSIVELKKVSNKWNKIIRSLEMIIEIGAALVAVGTCVGAIGKIIEG